MYRCDDCGRIFDEPELIHDTWESYYGVSSMFPNSNSMTIEVCPHCNSEDIDFYDEDDDLLNEL